MERVDTIIKKLEDAKFKLLDGNDALVKTTRVKEQDVIKATFGYTGHDPRNVTRFRDSLQHAAE